MTRSAKERCRMCVDNIKSILSSVSGRNHYASRIDAEQANDYWERFSLWAGNIGSMHDPVSPLSLETRLKTDPKVLDLIYDLLDDLAEITKELCKISSGERVGQDDFSAEDEDEEPKTDEDVLIEAISDCITRLFRVSSLIRRAQPIDLFAKALSRDRYKFPDHFDIANVGEKYPNLATSELAWLGERFGQAITKRRHIISYTQDHREKLEGNPEHEQDHPHTPHEDTNAISQSLDADLVLDSTSRPSTFITKASTLQPGQATAALTPGLDDADDAEDAMSCTTISRSVADDTESSTTSRIPNMDELPKGPGNQVECTICFRYKKFKNEKAWRKQVYSDLRAYVCMFKECEDVYFGDVNEWFRHEMDTYRVKYVCSICPTKVYWNDEHYLAHVERQHPILLEHGDRKIVLDVARQPVREIPAEGCVCCTGWVDRIRAREHLSEDTPNGSICVTPTMFKRHVASHMEQLALFAMPLASGLMNETSDGAVEALTPPNLMRLVDRSEDVCETSQNTPAARERPHDEFEGDGWSIDSESFQGKDRPAGTNNVVGPGHIGYLNLPDIPNSGDRRKAIIEKIKTELIESRGGILSNDSDKTLQNMATIAIEWTHEDWLTEAGYMSSQILKRCEARFGREDKRTQACNAMLYNIKQYSTVAQDISSPDLEDTVTKKLQANYARLIATRTNEVVGFSADLLMTNEEEMTLILIKKRSSRKHRIHSPATLWAKARLTLLYWRLKRVGEAKKLGAELREQHNLRLGEGETEHPDTPKIIEALEAGEAGDISRADFARVFSSPGSAYANNWYRFWK